ncbi:putative secreted protein [Rhodopirellula maiorica SM1]|uniref:Putative secreted protein n=1 Tax=Rhodopirellula maiorica SM1 TaxID=1265738 RepID=M5R7Z0_9BACT|nr:putative secreted protein [Rhodopirellula maiorica]EMI15505.1 putative secreted protein [Rhodopirellula maiorica SM1]
MNTSSSLKNGFRVFLAVGLIVSAIAATHPQTLFAQNSTVTLTFQNNTNQTVDIYYDDEQGNRPQFMFTVNAGETQQQSAYEGNLWLIQARDQSFASFYRTPASDTSVPVNSESDPNGTEASSRQGNPAQPAAVMTQPNANPTVANNVAAANAVTTNFPTATVGANAANAGTANTGTGAPTFIAATSASEQRTFHASKPQILSVTTGDGIIVAWQSWNGNRPAGARIAKISTSNMAKVWEKQLSLDLLGGLTTDGQNFYTMSAKLEDLNNEGSVVNYRDGILHLAKFDGNGQQLWMHDVNNVQYLGAEQNGQAENGIYSPMDSGTGCLVFGNNQILAVLSLNTVPDQKGTRHQTSMFFTVSAADGTPTQSVSKVSWRHSFDQRAIFDGEKFVIADLGDAGWYLPGGGIAMRKATPNGKTTTFTPKQAEGTYVYVRQSETAGNQNFSFTSLGDIGVGQRGYTVVFTSEPNNNVSQRSGWNTPIAEPRNLGLVHVTKNFDTVKDGQQTWQDGNTVVDWSNTAAGKPKINVTSNVVDSVGPTNTAQRPDKSHMSFTQTGVVWLTNLQPGTSAERPKLASLGNGNFLVAWEEWTYQGNNINYASTKAMVIDEYGQIIVQPKAIAARLNPSGADRFMPYSSGTVYWITGQPNNGGMKAHFLDANLNLTSYPFSL